MKASIIFIDAGLASTNGILFDLFYYKNDPKQAAKMCFVCLDGRLAYIYWYMPNWMQNILTDTRYRGIIRQQIQDIDK
jgi:hypothetical protein